MSLDESTKIQIGFYIKKIQKVNSVNLLLSYCKLFDLFTKKKQEISWLYSHLHMEID